MWKPGRKSPLGRSGRTWEDNIRVDLKQVCLEDVNWVDLSQVGKKWQAVVNMVTDFRVP